MSKSLFSINGVTINTDYLLYIEPRMAISCSRVVAVMTGTKDDWEVTLINNLKTFDQAKYIANIIADEIDSECDINISPDDLAEYLAEYEELEEDESDYDDCNTRDCDDPDYTYENDEEEPETDMSQSFLSGIEKFIRVHGTKYPVRDTGVTVDVIPEKQFMFANVFKYKLEADFGRNTTVHLMTCNTEEAAEKCKRLFLEDIKNGITEFDSNYFYQLEMR